MIHEHHPKGHRPAVLKAPLPSALFDQRSNTIRLAIDHDGDGTADLVRSSTFDYRPGLRAAACAKKITPIVGVNHSDPIFIAGFDQNRPATGVNDDTWARGVVLEDAGIQIALVTLDVVGYFNNEVQTARSLVNPALGFDAIFVTSTHTHETADTLGLWGVDLFNPGVDFGYLDFVNQHEAAFWTQESLQPVSADALAELADELADDLVGIPNTHLGGQNEEVAGNSPSDCTIEVVFGLPSIALQESVDPFWEKVQKARENLRLSLRPLILPKRNRGGTQNRRWKTS